MSNQLPVFIDPLRFAHRGQTVSGNVSLQGMERLSSYLYDNDGEVSVTLEFGVDSQEVYYMSVALRAHVHVVCQRCLQSMGLLVSHESLAGLVKSEAAIERLSSEYEPFVVEPEPVLLKALVEDELILAMPVASMHLPEECENEVLDNIPLKDEPELNPFSVLAQLKGRQD